MDEQRAKQTMKDRKEVEEMEAKAKEIAETYRRALAVEHSAAGVVSATFYRQNPVPHVRCSYLHTLYRILVIS